MNACVHRDILGFDVNKVITILTDFVRTNLDEQSSVDVKTDTRRAQDGHKTDTRRTQDGHKTGTRRTQDGHKTDTRRTQDGHKTDTRRTQDGHKTDTRRAQDGHKTGTRRIMRLGQTRLVVRRSRRSRSIYTSGLCVWCPSLYQTK